MHRENVTRRKAPRFAVAVPVDVVVLRSGIPASIPGRSLDVSEGGMAAVLAGEVQPGESVGIEFKLPFVSEPVQAKATVKHYGPMRCGLEFLAMPPEQLGALQTWAKVAAEAARGGGRLGPQLVSNDSPANRPSAPVASRRGTGFSQKASAAIANAQGPKMAMGCFMRHWAHRSDRSVALGKRLEGIGADRRGYIGDFRTASSEDTRFGDGAACGSQGGPRLPAGSGEKQAAGARGARCDRGSRRRSQGLTSNQWTRFVVAIGNGCRALVAIPALSGR